MVAAEQIKDEANATEEVAAEATILPGAAQEAQAESTPPVGPTVEQLEAKLNALEAKYKKEVGDRDRGSARQAGEIEKLKGQLAKAIKGSVALARRTFGEEETPPEETEFQKWQREHGEDSQPTPPTPPKQTPAQRDVSVALNTLAEEYGVDTNNPPAELNGVMAEMVPLYDSETPEKAVEVWRAALRQFKAGKAGKEVEAKPAPKKDPAPILGAGVEHTRGTGSVTVSSSQAYKDRLKKGEPLPTAQEIDRITASFLGQ